MTRHPHVLTGPFAPPAPASELTVRSADGTSLHVEVHGPSEGPTVVLVHGWTCSTAFWSPVVRRLTGTGHRVVLYDQRGHGRSPAGSGERAAVCSTYALEDDLCAVLDATLSERERAVLGGHSMGGMTLMAAAGRPQLREHAAALLLCSTGARRLLAESRVLPLRSARGRTRAHRLVLGSPMPLGPVTALSRRLLRYATMGPGATAEQIEACARIVHACPSRVRRAWSAVLGALDLAAKVPGLTVPTAVVVGSRDRLTPPMHARELATALPHCTALHELPGAGHMTPIEEPDAVADVLLGLTKAHLGRSGRVRPLTRPSKETS